jgi:uncharacterized protein YidB (DUF937 family)
MFDEDDAQGYLNDFVLGWASENGVKTEEDLKNLTSEFPDFVRNALEIAGALPDPLDVEIE